MRDTIKSEQYFNEYIQYQEARIKKFIELREKVIRNRGDNDKGVVAATTNLFNFSYQLFVAKYSLGIPVTTLRKDFITVVNWFVLMSDVSYGDAINMLSLGILISTMENTDEIKSKLIHENLIETSSKILTIKDFFTELCAKCKPYAKLIGLSKTNVSGDVIKNYLAGWYDDFKDAYWHESHKSSNNTYFGYWSFESAAYAKVYDIDISAFNSLDYFPIDLV